MRKRIDEIILEDIVLVSLLVLAVRPYRRKQGDAGAEDKENYAQEDQERLVLQYSCLENHMDRGAWKATVHGVANSRT